jgi:hypothetical protein
VAEQTELQRLAMATDRRRGRAGAEMVHLIREEAALFDQSISLLDAQDCSVKFAAPVTNRWWSGKAEAFQSV